MLMHFLNNLMSVVALYFQDELLKLSGEQIPAEMAEAEMIGQADPLLALITALLFLGIGVLLLNIGNTKKSSIQTSKGH